MGLKSTVIAATYIRPPYTYPCVLETPITCENKGINFDLFHHLMSVLGYGYKVVQAEDNISGYVENGTLKGILGQLARKEVDMSANLAAIDPERLEFVDFSAPVTYIDYGFLIRKQRGGFNSPSLFKFLISPYSTTVWIYMIGLLLCAVSIYFAGQIVRYWYLRDSFSGAKSDSLLTYATMYEKSIFRLVRSFLGQTEFPTPRNSLKAQRRMSYFWEFSIFVFVAVYQGQLTGKLLVDKKQAKPFTDLAHVAQLVYDNKFTFVTDRKREMFEPLSENEGNTTEPREKIRIASKWNPPVFANTTEELVELIVSRTNLVYFDSFVSVQDAAAYSCHVDTVRLPNSQSFWLSFMFQKHSKLAEQVTQAFYHNYQSVNSYMDRMYKRDHSQIT